MPSSTTSKPAPGPPHAVGPPPTSTPAPQGRARGELLLQRNIRSGWLCIAVGVIIPLLALGGPFYGVRVARMGRRGMGTTLIVVGLAVFLTRMILYLG